VRRNEELEIEYVKAKETIARLENKVEKLERENKKLRKLNNTLINAIIIAQKIPSREKQDLHLSTVVERIKKELEEVGKDE